MLKALIYSILINIVIIYLFVEFIVKPINEMSVGIAKSICINNKLNCEFKGTKNDTSK